MSKEWQKLTSERTKEEKEKIAKCLPQDVDVNTMVHFLDFVSQDFSAIQTKYGKVKPWETDAEDIKWFLTFFAESKSTEINQEQTIPVDRVFSKPWNQWRLALALAHRKLGQEAPAINVSAYKMKDNSYWYTINDGMHRTTAAKMAGQKTIKAHVREERILLSNKYALYDGHLFKVNKSDFVLMSSHLPKGYYNFLEDLFGVKRYPHNSFKSPLLFPNEVDQLFHKVKNSK